MRADYVISALIDLSNKDASMYPKNIPLLPSTTRRQASRNSNGGSTPIGVINPCKLNNIRQTPVKPATVAPTTSRVLKINVFISLLYKLYKNK